MGVNHTAVWESITRQYGSQSHDSMGVNHTDMSKLSNTTMIMLTGDFIVLLYYKCIYSVRTFSSGTESEALAVTRWAAW